MRVVFNFLLFFLLPFFVWSVGNLFLDQYLNSTPVIKKSIDYFNINLSRLFYTVNSVKTKAKKEVFESVGTFKLKAVYNDGKKAFIILMDKNKNVFLNKGESYKGYKLIKVKLKSAILEKNAKMYEIRFDNKVEKNAYSKEEYINKIPRRKLYKYTKLSNIWNNISIVKVAKGYKITYVKKGSIFDKLGLKKGDIILSVNGVELKSDADAWRLYKNIDKFSNFDVEIKRNNQIKVLHYEID